MPGDNIQQEMEAAIEQLRQVTQQTNDGAVAVNQLRIEQEGVQAGIDRLNKIKEDTTADLEQVRSSLDSATIARSEVLSDIEVARRDLAAIHADLDSTRTASEAARVSGEIELKTFANEKHTISVASEARVAQARIDLVETQKQSEPFIEQVSRLREQVRDLTADANNLVLTIAKKEGELSDLQSKIEEATLTVKDTQAGVENLSSNLIEKREQSAHLDIDIINQNETIADLSQKIAELQVELEKNSTANADFLKDRATVIALQQTNLQREEFLKQKYGELGETFN